MSKQAIWIVIIFMSVSLIGVGIIQVFWIRQAINLGEKNFDDKVAIALNNVRKKITLDTEYSLYERYYEEKGIPIPNHDIIRNFRQSGSSSEIEIHGGTSESIGFPPIKLDPDELLESININRLDKTLHIELENNKVDLLFEYGVFSSKYNSYFIENGSYTATIGDTTKSSNVAALNPLYKAEFKIALFDNGGYSPGHLNIYFPDKKKFLWSSVMVVLVFSVIFTGLILASFAYTIYVIVLQKKISEIKTDFINNMTHEFKTPIATISLASDSILSPVIIDKKDKVERFVNIIKHENKRMLSQVEKVLQMAQIDKKNVELKFKKININELTKDAVVNAELKVQAKGGSITTRLNAIDPIVEADETHIASIINNLLDNAEKYTPENPEIVVETRQVKNGVEISVADNGVGMTKDASKLIFEKFYRVHTGNLHDVKGFGLGLSYVKAMVDAHNGTINVKSEPGKGSTFTIFLPRQQKLSQKEIK